MPIGDMTKYTDKMKQAPSRSKKAQIVKELSQEPRFTEINSKFMKMQAAKDLLKRRYEEQTGTTSDKSERNRVISRLNGFEVKAGQEVQIIEEWQSSYDEIEELKKVFFEFFKRWTDTKTDQ